jgi:hypothetical protein
MKSNYCVARRNVAAQPNLDCTVDHFLSMKVMDSANIRTLYAGSYTISISLADCQRVC